MLFRSQVLQLNRELAKGNGHVVGSIASRIKTTGSGNNLDAIALGTATNGNLASANRRLATR